MGSAFQRIPIDSGETRPFKDGKGQLEVVDTGTGMVGRAVFEPGWKWSEHVKPIAGTDSCQAPHMGYVLSGRMRSAVLTISSSSRFSSSQPQA